MQACTNGYICDRGASLGQDSQCIPGFFPGDNSHLRESCTTCSAGNYCSGSAQLTCLIGFYCPQGTTNPFAYSSQYGYYIPLAGQTSITNQVSCTAGNYCPRGSQTYSCIAPYSCSYPGPVLCPVGSYSTINNHFVDQTHCILCDAGQKCTSTGTSSLATDGYYSPIGFSIELQCQPGSYSDATTDKKNLDSCIVCPIGKYCLGTATLNNCPAGYYFPTATKAQYQFPCPYGTFKNAIGGALGSSGDCTSCTLVTQFCPQGSTSPLTCPVGSQCANGKSTACSDGFKREAADDPSACLQCGQGYICPSSFNDVNPIICPVGYYMNSAVSPGPCTSCEIGKKCDTPGLSNSIWCPSGFWSIANAPSCTSCPVGYYCLNNGATNTKTMCSDSNFCSAGSSAQVPCSAGSFCLAGSNQEFKCLPGTYSNGAVNSCTTSIAKYYTLQGQTSAQMMLNLCGAGFYCQPGSKGSQDMPCPAGTFSIAGQAGNSGECTSCQLGYFCPLPSSQVAMLANVCPAGSYCDGSDELPNYCPTGTYNILTGKTASTDCLDCPQGKACLNTGIGANGAADTYDVDCDPGFYCTIKCATSQPLGICGNKCSKHHYCPSGSFQETDCISGTYNLRTMSSVSSDCLDCPP